MAYLFFKGRLKRPEGTVGDCINTLTVTSSQGDITLDREETTRLVYPEKDSEGFQKFETKWCGVYDLDMIDKDASFIDEAAYISDDEVQYYKDSEVVEIDYEDETPEEYEIFIDSIEMREDTYEDDHLNIAGIIERPLDSCV